MKYFFIAEKSSLMKEIQSVYQKIKSDLPYQADFDCFAGHIIRRAEPKEYEKTHPEWGGKWNDIQLPIVPQQFLLKVSDSKIYSRLTNKIKEGNYDVIVNACDPEREGMAIYELFHIKAGLKQPVKRFWSNDLTEKAIVQALHNLRDNQKDTMLVNLKNAAMLRGEFDWLVGMNFTIGYSLKTNSLAKVGRVKTPTLAIIVNRELELKNFKPRTTYAVESEYNENFKAIHINEDGEVRFETKNEAESFLENLHRTAKITKIQSKEEEKVAPALFKLSTLQIEADKAFGYSGETSIAVCQYLYEQKITSYPRTDCEFVSTELTKEFPTMLKAVGSLVEFKSYVENISNNAIAKASGMSKYVNDKKLAESGHSALVPTGKLPNLQDLEKNLTTFNKEHNTHVSLDEVKNILLFIFKRFLGIFLPPQKSLVKEILVDNNNKLFKATGKTIINMGFMLLYGGNTKDTLLPEGLQEGQAITIKENIIQEKVTTPPSRFTDGTLIAAMENPAKYLTDVSLKKIINEKNGIGTPATRVEVIKELIRNGYVEKKKQSKREYLVPTEMGTSLILQLKDEDIVSVDMTGGWENRLKEVEQGQQSQEAFRTAMSIFINETIRHIQKSNDISQISKNTDKESIGKCPLCGADVIEGKTSYYCSKYKEGCKYGFGKEAVKGITKKSITLKEAKEIVKTGKLKNQKGTSKAGQSYNCYFEVTLKDGRPQFDLKFEKK